ncbi:hypothetical protein M758_7G035400 [Ceratodon purpureus]|uniref:Uncharacterized protein n=1 Tax=Ceratodon purpureus TaxID=3225 RepID=A0A8T0H7B2_CERPU|nr:hypothetical protein KC19_7G036900 [Ceratodon purpureus]KAG0610053.1 hypothetical protein M758_7G035400 [Ceratodon purpureus]
MNSSLSLVPQNVRIRLRLGSGFELRSWFSYKVLGSALLGSLCFWWCLTPSCVVAGSAPTIWPEFLLVVSG